MKLEILIAALLVLSGVSSAASFEIRDQCKSDEEPLFSMYSKTGGNAGMPGYYKNQVCASKVSEAEFSQSCDRDKTSILSFFQKNDSHVSVFENYRWDLCASDIQVTINNSCAEENIIASLNSKDDTHVAKPNYYKYQLCESARKPTEVTIEATLDAESIYVDGEKAEEREYSAIEVAYPYIASDQPFGIVSYGKFKSLEYQNNSGREKIRMTQKEGSFLLPNTRNGYIELEDEEKQVLDRTFLDNPAPNFGYKGLEKPVVRAMYDPDHKIRGFEGQLGGSIQLYVRNRFGNGSVIEIKPVQ